MLVLHTSFSQANRLSIIDVVQVDGTGGSASSAQAERT